MAVYQRFTAPSPQDGRLKEWEAVTETDNPEPQMIVARQTRDEQYRPGETGFAELLGAYKRMLQGPEPGTD
ncbi:hypothetical protein GF356_05495 [candidate division GN15 bacterium]|nr:hypothetical protein [candidate division GN15 bacterium]